MKSILHRDQIHGDVRYDPLAVALLDTPALQRLGRIFQLGYAHLVFRGGTHTRLSHIMGTYHVAGQIVQLLRQNYDGGNSIPKGAVLPSDFLPIFIAQTNASVQGNLPASTADPRKILDNLELRWEALEYLVRWAALLHDVGHIPLGHTLEDEFDGIYDKHDKINSKRLAFLWNDQSDIRKVFSKPDSLPSVFKELGISWADACDAVMLICLHKEGIRDGKRISFGSYLKEEVAKNPDVSFAKFALNAFERLSQKLFFPYMADIVGNTICADYLDYVRRDPSNTGLDILRDNRVASRFYVGAEKLGPHEESEGKEQYKMALSLVDAHGKPRLDTCTGVVELVRQRFRFAEIIYYHKTKVSASAMLAKVFSLIGKPKEVGEGVDLISLDKVEAIGNDLLSNKKGVVELRARSLPSALLDPEIGDDSLLLLLQTQAWDKLQSAAKSNDADEVKRCLRGISLLQAIARRQLYKAAFSANGKVYKQLAAGSGTKGILESKIQATLTKFRTGEKGHEARSQLEKEMAEAAGWPDGSLLIYIPDRKAQAKGIETGALDNGDVIRLGEHKAVREEVDHLNKAYKGLWRILVFVHPDYRRDNVGLSAAIDTLVKRVWEHSSVNGSLVNAIEEASWFPYIPEQERRAAHEYIELMGQHKLDWGMFNTARDKSVHGTMDSREHAARACFLSLAISNPKREGSVKTMLEDFGTPGSFLSLIEEREKGRIDASREGISNLRRTIIEDLIHDLPNLKQKKLI